MTYILNFLTSRDDNKNRVWKCVVDILGRKTIHEIFDDKRSLTNLYFSLQNNFPWSAKWTIEINYIIEIIISIIKHNENEDPSIISLVVAKMKYTCLLQYLLYFKIHGIGSRKITMQLSKTMNAFYYIPYHILIYWIC